MKLDFDESDSSLLVEALTDLLEVKKEAYGVLNKELAAMNRPLFTERDFGMPRIRDLITRIEEAPEE